MAATAHNINHRKCPVSKPSMLQWHDMTLLHVSTYGKISTSNGNFSICLAKWKEQTLTMKRSNLVWWNWHNLKYWHCSKIPHSWIWTAAGKLNNWVLEFHVLLVNPTLLRYLSRIQYHEQLFLPGKYLRKYYPRQHPILLYCFPSTIVHMHVKWAIHQ